MIVMNLYLFCHEKLYIVILYAKFKYFVKNVIANFSYVIINKVIQDIMR